MGRLQPRHRGLPGASDGPCSRKLGATDLTIDVQQPRRRSAVQGRRHVAHRPVGEDRRQGRAAARASDPAVLRGVAQVARVRCLHRLQLQSVINPIADVTKFLGSSGNNYGQYDGSGARGDLRQACARFRRWMSSAPSCASTRSGRSTRRRTWGFTLWWYKINPHTFLRERVDRSPQPLPQPAARQRLDRQVVDVGPEGRRLRSRGGRRWDPAECINTSSSACCS